MSLATALKILVAVAFLAGCSNRPEGTYRGGVLVQPRPLAIQDHYVFRLADKWRISHAWLSGPVDIDYCHYRNDREDRFFEVEGVLQMETTSDRPQDKGKKSHAKRQERIYGTNPRTGKFEGYSAFCKHTFQDIWTGATVYLVKPDPAKGTDAWIAGAQPLTVNGLRWLRKEVPIADYSQNRKQWTAAIETWVLKIPDTPYWLVMQIASSTGGAGTAPGSNRNPVKFAQVLDLFHQMVASVKLEPLLPADTAGAAAVGQLQRTR